MTVVRYFQQQTEPGECIECHGGGTVPTETFYGLDDEEDDEECGVCNGNGTLTVADLRRLGWRP